MNSSSISVKDPYARFRVAALDTEMAYIEVGEGDPIVFLHGNPTSSYLWRNIIAHLEGLGRCLAPDLVGMGESGKAPAHSYRFVDHARYLDRWFEAVGVERQVMLVVHDWGAALGFYWAQRHPERIKGIAYMECVVRPTTWQDWGEPARSFLETVRSPAGEQLILAQDSGVGRALQTNVIRRLSEEELAVYCRPYLQPGETRRPILTWLRENPIEGEPADVAHLVEGYAKFLRSSRVPKLFLNADPGAILIGAQREFCRRFPNQEEVTVKGLHFIQEDSPMEIGQALADFVKSISA
jgi:haloalkane dehalogenase